jgi:hypothetical protein
MLVLQSGELSKQLKKQNSLGDVGTFIIPWVNQHPH